MKEVASTRNSDLAGLAKVALAAFYGNNNRAKEAADVYKELIDKPTTTVSKVMAQMQLAAMYESRAAALGGQAHLRADREGKSQD